MTWLNCYMMGNAQVYLLYELALNCKFTIMYVNFRFNEETHLLIVAVYFLISAP